MKKKPPLYPIFCLTLISVLTSIQSIAQFNQYKPSLSDLSGNGPTLDGKGYVYTFNGNEYTSCLGMGNNKGVFNQFQSKNYSYKLDQENGYFILSFNGKQEETELLCNHLTSDNCFLIEQSPSSTFLDLSNPKNQKIELRVKSDVAVERFGVYIISVNQEGVALIGDADEYSYELKANKWTTIKTEAVFTLWDDTPLDPSRVTGIGIYAKSHKGNPFPIGNIEIDEIRIGSAVHKFDALGSPSKEGYTYNFLSDEDHFCKRQMNILNNPIFNLSIDQTNHDAVLTQKVTSSKYNLFAMEFTDRDCFLTNINLEDKKNQFVEVKIKPTIDIHTFNVSVSGYMDVNKEWDFSIPEKSVSLKGGQWNIVKLPIGFNSNTGSTLDPTKIRGVLLEFNHNHENAKKIDSTITSINYAIDYIKIGKDILTENK